MDLDIDQEEEREKEEYEQERSDSLNRLQMLKRTVTEKPSALVSFPNIAPGLSTLDCSSFEKSNHSSSSGKIVTPSSSSLSSSSSTSQNSAKSTPQKFIIPKRPGSQSNSQSQASDNNSQNFNFAIPSSPAVASSSVVTPSKPTGIPSFNSSSPAASKSPGYTIGEFNIPFPSSASSITANSVHLKNPMTKYIRENVIKVNYVPEWKLTDFILGKHTTALYVSLRYHLTKPKFIFERITNFHKTEICKRNVFTAKIVLVNIDVTIDASGDYSHYQSGGGSNSQQSVDNSRTYISEAAFDEAMIEITRICMWGDWTMVCGYSDQECALYLETFRLCESKSAAIIQGPGISTNSTPSPTSGNKKRGSGGNRRWSRDKYSSPSSSSSKPTEVETLSHTEEVHQLFASSFKQILNKRDHVTLLNHFGSVKELIHTTPEELNDLPGFGKKKVKRLVGLFQTPFIPGKEGDKKNPTEASKKQTKKLNLVKKTTQTREESDDDVIIVDNETGKETKYRTKTKQATMKTFLSQTKEEED